MQATANVQTTSASPVAATSLEDAEVWTHAQNNFWMFVANSCALGGSIFISLFGVLKARFPNSYGIATAYGAAYLPYIGPDIIGVVQNFYKPKTNRYNYMNFGLGTVGLVKAFVDIKLAKGTGTRPGCATCQQSRS